jgi:hypothetical protein
MRLIYGLSSKNRGYANFLSLAAAVKPRIQAARLSFSKNFMSWKHY